MDKPLIDDAMIARFRATPGVMAAHLSDDRVREILRVTLTPSVPEPEPEIPISDRMRNAGFTEWAKWMMERSSPTCVTRLYVAMERERLRELAEQSFKPGPMVYVQNFPHSRVGDRATRQHRRATDPGGYLPHSMQGLLSKCLGYVPRPMNYWVHARSTDSYPIVAGAVISPNTHRRKDDLK